MDLSTMSTLDNTVPTYEALRVPPSVRTVLITGAAGFVGQELTKLLLKLWPDVKLITTDIVSPPAWIDDQSRLQCVQADLSDAKQVEALFASDLVDGVFAGHGIMSGACEADYELGFKINVESHLLLLKTARSHATLHGIKPIYVFLSSLAVYGNPGRNPNNLVSPLTTPTIANSSYGIEKQMIELLCNDYGRRGFLDTRIVRLPTVVIRPGAPSSAASSFVSGLIREPLQGLATTCPVADGRDDPFLTWKRFHCTRIKTLTRNVAYALCMPETVFDKTPTLGRVANLPGFQVTTEQMLKALAKHGGEDKLQLVTFEKNDAVLRICKDWSPGYESKLFEDMGFEKDDDANGYELAVKDFMEVMNLA